METVYDDENVQLIEMENEVLREGVGRHRQNVERLVEMLTVVLTSVTGCEGRLLRRDRHR